MPSDLGPQQRLALSSPRRRPIKPHRTVVIEADTEHLRSAYDKVSLALYQPARAKPALLRTNDDLTGRDMKLYRLSGTNASRGPAINANRSFAGGAHNPAVPNDGHHHSARSLRGVGEALAVRRL